MRVSAGFAAQADSFSSVSHRRCGSRDRFAADPEHQKIIDTAADRLGFAEAGGDVNRAHETRTQGFPEPRVFGGGIELTGTNCLLDNEGTALAHAVYAFALSSTARLRLNSNPDRHLPAAVRAMKQCNRIRCGQHSNVGYRGTRRRFGYAALIADLRREYFPKLMPAESSSGGSKRCEHRDRPTC